jgi:ABC-type transporter lipoprotein component MlaA/pimeloyl-ACP methyl ester carboxylesterase
MKRSIVLASLLAALAAPTDAPAAEHEESQRLKNLTMVGVDSLRAPTPREQFELVRLLPDPIEGFNRGSLGFTKGVLDWVVRPLALGWRAITPGFVRTGVENFAYNIAFPVRFVSLLLQGELVDTGQEVAHFATNTTIGVAGFLDVATPIGIPTHRAKVGLAFARWGAGPGFYFVIPLLGPSTGRDALGRLFDTALSPATYVPGAGLFFTTNAFAGRVGTYDALVASNLDLYGVVRAVWALRRRIDATRYRIPAEAYATADPEPSLGILRFRVKDTRFPGRARQETVVSPRTEREVPYSLWLQPGSAPVVYLIPGIGAHRRSTNPVALAELAYAAGCSVVALSSPFHPEFILTGLSSLYPGYTPDDAADLHALIARIDAELRERHGARIGGARLVGYSLGAIESLFIADLEGAPRFERIVALNPPVDLFHAASGFDAYFDAPARWPEAERNARIEQLGLTAFLLAQDGMPADGRLPLDRTESEFLIGLSGRTTMVNALAAIERRGGGSLSVSEADREQQGVLFAEINQGSLRNYGNQLAVPYFSKAKRLERPALLENANLTHLADRLRGDERIRVLTNADDFILGAENLAWLASVLGDRLRVFPEGGHLGNLWLPEVQQEIVERLRAP